MLIVYFSSATGNTKRFVVKLGLPAARIPLRRADDELVVDRPYVLICPTYGGGASLNHDTVRPVPPQVEAFLSRPDQRRLMRGVIASGNSNFGPDFCRAGDVISQRCQVPYLDHFELMGSDADVSRIREGLVTNAERLGLTPPSTELVDALRARDEEKRGETARRLAALRAKYHTSA